MNLRTRVDGLIEITRENVLEAKCSFALTVFDKLAGMELGKTSTEQCYACIAMFTRDPEGRIFYAGKCISTPTDLLE